jgi:hypothetical protein
MCAKGEIAAAKFGDLWRIPDPEALRALRLLAAD